MRRHWVGCVFVAAAVASSFAQDAKPAGDRFVLKVRVTGVDLKKADERPMVLAMPQSGVFADMSIITTLDAESGVLETVVTAPTLSGPGYFHLSFRGHPERGSAFVFFEDMRGELDLGELALGASARVLAAGRVVTADGKPAYGAHVFVTCRASEQRSFKFDELSATTDASGAFSVCGIVRGGDALTLELGVEDGWTADKAVPFTAGAADVKIVATRTSGVHGTVVVPGGLPLSDLVVMLRGPPDGVAAAELDPVPATYKHGKENLEFPAVRRFAITGLRPGTYELRLKFAGSSTYLARVTDVQLDETSQDLPPLEVKDAIEHAKARIVAAGGTAIAGAELWARNEGDRGKFRRIELGADASADVAFVGEAVTLAARAEGTDFVIVRQSAPEATLTLPEPASSTVTIEIADDERAKAVKAGASVVLDWQADASVEEGQLAWSRDDTDPRNGVSVEVAIPASGPVTAKVTVAGWYRMGTRRRQGTTTTTLCSMDRVKVQRGLPACARLQVMLDDVIGPLHPPK
jgi:hypothetical protein